MNEYCFIFPQRVINHPREISRITGLYSELKARDYDRLIFDFSKTTYFETNLCAVLYYLVEKLDDIEISVLFRFGANFKYRKMPALMRKIYSEYSADASVALLPRKLGLQEPMGSSALLLDELKKFQLREYETIKILLSELIANLKMHTLYSEGVCAGYHNYRNNTLIFSIVNYDITIARQIKEARKMEFQDDHEAILWALKKNNTTRSDDESGGLGLYLLRKYISSLGGSFYIVSGECYMEFDETCFDEKQENVIWPSGIYKLANRYEGTIITVILPIITKEAEETEEQLIDVSLEALGGEL